MPPQPRSHLPPRQLACWEHHSGYAPDRLVARSTASIVNSRRLVSRKVGCGAAAALAGHAGIAHNHDGLGVKVSVGWSDEHRIRAGSANATTRLRATVTAAATVTA